MGVRSPYGAAAGLDVENPEPLVFGDKLRDAVASGAIEPEVIDRACRRILTTLYRFAAAEDPLLHYSEALVASEPHRMLAREVAEKSAVLLTNDGTLPLTPSSLKSIAVLGRLAAVENTGDFGSSRVRAPYVVTPLEGLKAALPDTVFLTGDEYDLEVAAAAASDADVVIVVVGLTADQEGEFIPGDINLGQMGVPEDLAGAQGNATSTSRGGDRTSLRLPDDQRALIDVAARSGKPVVVVIVAGSAILIDEWSAKAGAILQTFYAGMEAGHALARLLLGVVSPSGKLPFTVAPQEENYPIFDPFADAITYDHFHGYTLADRDGWKPTFPFGHGLSYTRFGYRALRVRKSREAVEVIVDVANNGDCDADEVVQAYVRFPGKAIVRPRRLLRAFRRVNVPAGGRRAVRLRIPLDELRFYDPSARAWRLEPGVHVLSVGGTSDETLQMHEEIAL
jgi:beta-glucosidase